MSDLHIAAEFFPMNERDLDTVAALEASLQVFPWSRGNFADSLAVGHSAWVLRVGGDLIGFSVVMTVIDEAHLLNIGVCQRYQGQGYGARLLRHADLPAVGQRARHARLHLREQQQHASTTLPSCSLRFGRPMSGRSSCIAISVFARLACARAITQPPSGVKMR